MYTTVTTRVIENNGFRLVPHIRWLRLPVGVSMCNMQTRNNNNSNNNNRATPYGR